MPNQSEKLRPISVNDMVIESNRNYDLGRKHGIEETIPSLETVQKLLLKIAEQQKQIQDLNAQFKQCQCWTTLQHEY